MVTDGSTADGMRNDAADQTRYGGLRPYARTVAAAVPGHAALALGLMLLLSATEWVGLVMLIPMLAVAGLDVGGGMVGRVADTINAAFASAGLPLTVPTILTLYLVIVILRAFMQRRVTLATVELERSFLQYLRKRLYRAVVHARWLFFVRARSSDFLHTLMGQCQSASYATNLVLRLISSVLVGLVYLALALKLSPVMTLLAVACGLILVFLLRRGAHRSRAIGGELTRSNNRVLGTLVEHMAGMKTVKTCGAEGRNITQFGGIVDEMADLQRAATRNSASVAMGFDIGSTAALCGLLYVAVVIMQHTSAEILLLLFIFGRLVPRFSGLQQTYQSFVAHMPAFAVVMGRIERCEAEAEPHFTTAVPVPPLTRELRLEAVSFRYAADSGQATLADIDLVIPARRTTALVGPSGGGKSTLADLLMGLIRPDAGHVMIDGAPLAADQMRSWRERIGYVPQDTFLLHDTIRGNLLWACPDATEDDLWGALQLAAARTFVERLPNGLDTVIGDRGVLLSGGERQRIALARALLRKPAVLILDEATSALDSENELQIQRAIEQLHGHMTIVIITHRLAAVRGADAIHVIEGGRRIESGTTESLLARNGRFAALCRAQGIDDVPRVRVAVHAG